MDIKVPEAILNGIENIIRNLSSGCKLKGYRYFLGDPEGAHCKNFDDSEWNISDNQVFFKRYQGITWFRLYADIPEYIMDVPVKGSGVRLTAKWLAPVEGYIDGELRFYERTWMDFYNPEVYITKNASPRERHTAAFRFDLGEFCYFVDEFSFKMSLIIDRIEEIQNDLDSFKNELVYACGFTEVRGILTDVFALIMESLDKNEGILKLIGKIGIAREMLKPMEAESKKNIVHCIGHAHIDMNWFWTFDETLDVIKRDFTTMLQLMEEIPNFTFAQSQCAIYDLTETYYPEIFAKIREYIKSGNWEVTASGWVENDMNLPSGESIVRQILYSKKYLKEKFGIEPRIMWLPDTFGHAASLPQILKKGGIDYYMPGRCGKTDDMLWWWEGVDGSKILAFHPYSDIVGVSSKFKKKYELKELLLYFGMGDHGGGPTRREISRIKKLDSYPTTPRFKFGNMHEYLDHAIDKEQLELPSYKGELNFIFQGCYTTHSDIKKYNRLCENILYNTEVLNTTANLYGMAYRGSEIEKCWKMTLFNQFHDIIGGCGAKATYSFSSEMAEKVLETMREVSDESTCYISRKIKTTGKGIPYAVFNTTGWERSEIIKIKKPNISISNYSVMDADSNIFPAQASGDELYIHVKGIPPLGYRVIYLEEETDSICSSNYKKINETMDENTNWGTRYFKLETRYYKMEIKKDSGEIVTLYDKINKKSIADRGDTWFKMRTGTLNTLQVYYELPAPLSAWSINHADRIDNLVTGAVTTIKEDGPLVKVINVVHKFSKSVVSQDIVIYENCPRIDFITHIDWNEYGTAEKSAPMLKVCFSPQIQNSYATYEIPYAAIDRANVDMEVPALKWADIWDGDYGFSVINDCKYGHRVKGNSMEITLIRSGWEPDAQSDVGVHDFIYSIFPHKGSWKECGTVKESYCLNNGLISSPISVQQDALLPEISTLADIDNRNIVVSALKLSEAGDALILRIYESTGAKSHVSVRLGLNISVVEEIDLNESEVYGSVYQDNNVFSFDICGFEIKTFKLCLNR